MKNIIINKLLNILVKYKNYSETEIEELKYGLTSIYLLISKLIIIIPLAIILNLGKECLIFLFFYNIIRTFSFGLHASKSYICLILSTIIFIGIPFLCTKIIISLNIKVVISILCIILLFKNSPADTKKRPILSKNRRLFFKYISVLIAIIYSFVSIFTNDYISNNLLFSLMLQVIITSPITYRLFNMTYNNYLNYDALSI